MKNHLTIKQNSKIVLSKTKALIGVTNKILSNKTTLSFKVDDDWIERL